MSTKLKLYVAQKACRCCGANNYFLMTLGKNPLYFESANEELVENSFKSIFTNPDDAVAAARAMGFDAINNLDEVV